MRGLQKSKRVCWATDGNLCQVRLFLSEDAPSQVGVGAQDHLQPKKKSVFLYNSGSVVPDDGLPPGFEGVNPETQLLKNKLAQIPLAKWNCPPSFLLDDSWRVTAGEESREVEIQNQRELRVLEAIYPRPSDIPSNPALSMDVTNIICDDSRTLLVPITPIEEEDSSEEASNDPTPSGGSYPPGFAQSVLPSTQNAPPSAPNAFKNGRLEECAQPQLLAAASAALSALVSGTGEQERLIDHDLLVKFLNNPAILEEFVKRQGNPSGSHDMSISSQPSLQVAPLHFNQRETPNISSSAMNPKEPFYPPQLHQHPPLTIPTTAQPTQMHPVSAPPPAKDINYYKSLIQQHGGERQQEPTPPPFMGQPNHQGLSPDPLDNTRPIREPKPKFMKPCIYFNTPKGCRHGANCSYQHDPTVQHRISSIPEMQSAKRMKMSREMRGPQSYS